jgi:hypothetical protein
LDEFESIMSQYKSGDYSQYILNVEKRVQSLPPRWRFSKEELFKTEKKEYGMILDIINSSDGIKYKVALLRDDNSRVATGSLYPSSMIKLTSKEKDDNEDMLSIIQALLTSLPPQNNVERKRNENIYSWN